MKKIYHLSYEFCGEKVKKYFDQLFEFKLVLDYAEESPFIPNSTIDFHTEVTTVKEATKPITETLAQ